MNELVRTILFLVLLQHTACHQIPSINKSFEWSVVRVNHALSWQNLSFWSVITASPAINQPEGFKTSKINGSYLLHIFWKICNSFHSLVSVMSPSRMKRRSFLCKHTPLPKSHFTLFLQFSVLPLFQFPRFPSSSQAFILRHHIYLKGTLDILLEEKRPQTDVECRVVSNRSCGKSWQKATK